MAKEKILLISDIDGTLVTSKMGMPAINVEAAAKLKTAGHYFTIATGRSYKAAMQYAKKIEINAPVITFNGAALYDYSKGKFIMTKKMPQTVVGIVRSIYDRFDEAGIEVHTEDDIYMIRNTALTKRHVEQENLGFITSSIDDIADISWLKVLLTAPPEVMPELERYAASLDAPELDFVRSGIPYFEILSHGVNKGTALPELIKYLCIQPENVYAIGDYYNDVGMLKAAAHAAAPEGAPDDIKALCEYIARPVEEGAVADYIEYILTCVNK